MSEHTPQHAGDDDAIVGRAFRWSLVVIVGGAALGGGLWWIATRPTQAPPRAVDEPSPPVQPERASVDALPTIPFLDVTAEAGITFERESGARGRKFLPETMGGGVAFLDADNDGDQDLFLVNGEPWAGNDRPSTTCAFYRNDGTGRFEEASAETGLDIALQGMGVAVGDFDNDGWSDLFVTAVGPNRLLRNAGGVFEDVTATAGVAGEADAWSTGTVFSDLDLDGDLDLFVCNYVRWSPEIDLEVDYQLTGVGRAYGPPTNYEGTQSVLYRNDGDGRFTDVSEAAGIIVSSAATGVAVGKGLAVAPIDLDGDGRMDLVVANDTVRNFVFRNVSEADPDEPLAGRLLFEEIGTRSGIAFDRNGAATGAMGLDVADYRDDGSLGIAVGNFANEMTSLFVASGDSVQFNDDAVLEGIGAATRLVLSFGLFFFDADLDGRLDLLQANGHIEDEIGVVQPSQEYAQAPQLFWNRGAADGPAFAVLPADSVGDLAEPLVGRGAAYADIDGDGDLDVILTQPQGAPRLLRNDGATGHRWLRVRLEGVTVNRDGIGAWVELTTDRGRQRRQVMPGRSYLSSVEQAVTFGLGDAEQVRSLRIVWPGGAEQDVEVDGLDREMTVRQRPSA